MAAINEETVGDNQTMTNWTQNSTQDYVYEISIYTDSEAENDEEHIDNFDDYSLISKSEILDQELFIDEESASKMEVDEKSPPSIPLKVLERPAKLEPRRVSLKDFMRQNSSLATDIPEFVPETDNERSESEPHINSNAIVSEQIALSDQVMLESEIATAERQPIDNSSSGAISEHEEGSIKNNSNGDSAELLSGIDEFPAPKVKSPFIPQPSYSRQFRETFPNPIINQENPPSVLRQQRREPDAGYGWERFDQSPFRNRDSFPPNRPPIPERFYGDRREYPPTALDTRNERTRGPVRPPRTHYRPEGRNDAWVGHQYNHPPPRDYVAEGPGFEQPPRQHWAENPNEQQYGWRERYANDVREPPQRYDYRQPRFRPPPMADNYRPPIRTEQEHFEYRNQLDRDARMYRPYPPRPRPDYNHPRQ